MLRHIVMFRWKDDADPAPIESALARVRELPGLIGNTIAFDLSGDAGVMPGNHEAVIVADFDDADAFLTYQRHPEHMEVVTEHLIPLIADRAAVQIDVAS